MKSWYAVVSKPRSEAVALDNLVRQGFECLLPRVRRLARAAGRMRGRAENRIESLFPGYLFLRADPDVDSLAPVRSTRGAIGVVRFGAEPARIPDAVVDRIRQRISEEDGLIHLDGPQFAPGQAVRVIDGPFSGIEGVFVLQQGDDRVRLLLDMLGGRRSAVLPRDSVIPSQTTGAGLVGFGLQA